MRYNSRRYLLRYCKEAYAGLKPRLALFAVRTRLFLRTTAQTAAMLWENSSFKDHLEYVWKDLRRGISSLPCLPAWVAGAGSITLVFFMILDSGGLEAAQPTHEFRQDLVQEEVLVDPASLNLDNYNKNLPRASGSWLTVGNISNHLITDWKEGRAELTGNKIQPSGTLLALQNGQPVLDASYGTRQIATITGRPVISNSTAIFNTELARIATGEHSVEVMLAEMNSQSALHYNWLHADALSAKGTNVPYNNAHASPATAALPLDITRRTAMHWTGINLRAPSAGADTPDFCAIDRMERGTWITLMRKNYAQANRRTARKASNYQEYVERFADRYALPPSLVYAIMHIESSFNPVAVSSANALGLMQVVPQTAGGEVYAYLNGDKGIPKPEVLFTPEKNIQYGTTYLHLLNSRHFKQVKDPISRELCIIAAYNGGPGAVYRVFSRDKNVAFEEINKLTPAELYTTLTTRIRSEETRDYLARVVNAKNDYRRGNLNF